MTPSDAYQQLAGAIREIALIDSAASTLGWDEQVYMPPAGTELRSNQQALLARLSHERFTNERIGEWLAAVESSELIKNRESDISANVRELRRLYDRARKLPTSLVEELSRTTVMAMAAWVDARKASQFATFEPWLDKLLHLKRQEAECIGYRNNPYDALLDAYEPGETAENVQQVFDSFRQRLVGLIARIVDSGKVAPLEVLERTYLPSLQETLCRDAAAAIGFDFSAGRLDVAVHPFCTGLGPGDTRITTRYDERFFGDAFFGVLHETGHALYEQGLPKTEHFGMPLGESISLGIHESQSRMWENLVGRRASFWKHFFPKVTATFGDSVEDITPSQWLFAINDVRPSLIRTESDETTYNMHVMLRFELEQAMIRNDIKAHDVPSAWNERMRSYLGLTPPDDARGCLQDVHWCHGAFGYFPTYTLGNLYASQFFEQAMADLGDVDAMFAAGEFKPLLGWLRERIHRHGKRYTAGELVQKVTGKPLTAEPLMRHLEANARMYYGV